MMLASDSVATEGLRRNHSRGPRTPQSKDPQKCRQDFYLIAARYICAARETVTRNIAADFR